MTGSDLTAGRPGRAIGSLAVRAATFTGVWLVLTEGDLRAWGFGIAGVVVATASSAWLLPPVGHRFVRPRAYALLLGFFAWQSVAGGVDVARRALSPRLPIRPGMVDVELTEHGEAARAGLAGLVSLLPGTVCVTTEPSRMRVHSLDHGQPVDARVRHAERRIAAVLGPAGEARSAQRGRLDRS